MMVYLLAHCEFVGTWCIYWYENTTHCPVHMFVYSAHACLHKYSFVHEVLEFLHVLSTYVTKGKHFIFPISFQTMPHSYCVNLYLTESFLASGDLRKSMRW